MDRWGFNDLFRNMKKILLILLGLLLPIASYAAPTTTYQRNLLPELTNTYDLGSASKIWNTLFVKNITISGTCTGCGEANTSTLQDVTNNGNNTTTSIQFAGGTSTAAFTIQGLLTAPTGSFTYTDATTTNATFATVGTLTASNATITNVSSTNMSVSSSLLVAGKAVCLADGTNCLPTTTPTLQQVATAGNTTSLALIFAGGTSTANFVVTGTFSAQTTTLGAITAGIWNGTVISETYGGTNQSTYTLGDTLYASAANTLSKLPGNTATTRKFYRQTGDGVNSAAPAWDTITAADVPGSALTKTDDTNVTLTLGGSPTTALLNATSLTLGWTGQLGLSRGGTNANLTASNGGICYSTATGLAILSGTATANKVLMSGASGAPSWSVPTYPNASATAGKIIRSDGTNYAASTATYPDTTTINQILYSSAANTISGITTANSGVLVTNGSGVPSIATDIPTAVTIGSSYIYRVGGTDVSVADGGSGASSFTANGVLLGNGTSAIQVTATGTTNQVLTSNGGATAPTFQTIPGATNGMSTLSGSVSISSTSFLDTGLSVTLPSAGTYLVMAQVRGFLYVNTGASAQITTRFYNSTDSSAITNSETIVVLAAQNSLSYINTAPMMQLITVTGSKTIKLQAQTVGGTTFTTRDIQGDGSGYTNMIYVKVSN